MAEDNIKLIETQNDTMWFAGSPLMICAVQLALDVKTGDVFTSAKFRNLSPKRLKSIRFDVICYDAVRQPIERLTGLEFQDLDEERNALFGFQRRIEIPDINTRNVEYVLKQAMFEDGTVWKNDDDRRFDTRIEQQSIYSVQGDCNKQFLDICARSGINGMNLVLQPEFNEEYWLCGCGAFNWHDEEKCSECKANREWLKKATDLDLLRQKKTLQEQQSEQVQAQVASMNAQVDKSAEKAEFEQRKVQLQQEQKKEKRRMTRKRLRLIGALLVIGALLAYLLMTFVFPHFLDDGKKQSADAVSPVSNQSVS